MDCDPLTTLANFLAAGSLTITLPDLGDSHVLCCAQNHHSDGWHTYPGYDVLAGLVSAKDETIVKVLDFLTSHHFILATCRLILAESLWKFIVRIYFIPYDLSGVKGSLRLREETVLATARKSLRILLPVISRDVLAWEGDNDGAIDVSPPLIGSHKVRLFHALIHTVY